MDINNLLFYVGLGIFFFLMSSGSELPALINRHLRHKHIEAIIAQLPETERPEFIRNYLNNPSELFESRCAVGNKQ